MRAFIEHMLCARHHSKYTQVLNIQMHKTSEWTVK